MTPLFTPPLYTTDGALFMVVCELFESLLEVYARSKGAARRTLLLRVASKWFGRFSGGSLFGLFRLLVPSEDYLRAYGIRETKLAGMLADALGQKGPNRDDFLIGRRAGDRCGAGRNDLGQVLVDAMKRDSSCTQPRLTVKAVGDFLDFLVSCKKTSDNSCNGITNINKELAIPELRKILLQMTALEAKWMVRIILKNLCLPFDHRVFFKGFHPHFFKMFRMQKDLFAACGSMGRYLASKNSERPTEDVSIFIRPRLGIYIAGMECGRGTGIEHVMKKMRGKTCHVETKYDGERLQIHLNGNWPEKVRIFCKSGVESTAIRFRCHRQLLEAFSHVHDAIVEGELVIYDEENERIEGFDAMYAIRSKSRLQRDPNGGGRHHLVVLYDILLLNGESLMGRSYHDRRHLLEQSVSVRPKFVETSSFSIVNFSSESSYSTLIELFNACTTKKEEGLVIKDSFSRYIPGDRSHWLKLNKDCIEGFGDTAEFVVIGASGNSELPGLFSDFIVAVLQNKEELAEEPTQKPSFLAVFNVSAGLGCEALASLQPILKNRSCSHPNAYEIEYAKGYSQRTDIIFSSPIVVELSGSGFVRNRGQRHLSLRAPRIRRILLDYDVSCIVSFSELQEMGNASAAAAFMDDDKINYRSILKKREIGSFNNRKIDNNNLISLKESFKDPELACSDNSEEESDALFTSRPFTDVQGLSAFVFKDFCKCPTERFALVPYLMEDYREEIEAKMKSLGYLMVHTVDALKQAKGERIIIVDDTMPWVRSRVNRELSDCSDIQVIDLEEL